MHRGFETHIHDLATVCMQAPNRRFNVAVASAYNVPNSTYPHKKLLAISRNNRWLQHLTSNLHTQFHTEQLSILLPLLLHIHRIKPRVVYLGEYQLYCWLYKWRQLFGGQWQLCLHTGGQAMPGLFVPGKDWVHHVTDRFVASCRQQGFPDTHQFVLPHLITEQQPVVSAALANVQAAAHAPIVLSVGSLDESVKGMLSLLKALAQCGKPVYPILLGEASPETPAIEQYLQQHFGNAYYLGKATQPELAAWYQTADLLVSNSKAESFGLVMLEAMLQGTPVICHPWPGARWVFQDYAAYFTSSDIVGIAQTISQHVQRKNPAISAELRTYVQLRFGTSLAAQYITQLNKMLTA
ncbi:glycosyltransferase family 4 protein [Phnomibacter ginsenosidimutans]|uniref:Glycosyltransferase n=1 Tax=Phnomibacter ginsenosidimutans TaxID=2676868 RepID=A0A6I6GH38_9BACT|nr:glycosyltransferase family 4 protein [Phnomibacter ginsenosidimutans]QGW29720.1 glycosyltransferase [Phnomibacter ginsenosidimutans]